jgi:hypothetical protein
LGEEFGVVAALLAEELAAALPVAVADIDVEAESALTAAMIPDVLTEGQGTCVPFAAPDVTGRPPMVVPADSASPPPSKVGNMVVARFPVVHGGGLGVSE